ncbi:helix-turn-helix domain-containing protein [Embleya sp. NBC_00888]|uniref:hypothetical protein n=1 Tax=Embleya sp. NBC_00888 TaxID=2975960 RepID=UPI0038684C78|nr:helix-turn-helix domain-containing protein [Embleya sp. NBC_00888]
MLLTPKGKPDASARSVLAVLAHHAHADGTNARPSRLRIQHLTGYDKATVRRALRRLEDGGLIIPDGTVSGCIRYRLVMTHIRPASDWTDLEEAEERDRAATAARVRKHRARVTDSDAVSVTNTESVTATDVTDSVSVRNGREQRYDADVTDSAFVCNALNAPRTVRNNQKEEEPVEPWAAGGLDDASGGAAEPPDEEPEVFDAEIVGEEDPPPPITAQSLVAEWLDHVPHRPPASVIGQTSRLLRQLLDEGIDPAHVRLGLVAWTRKGLHPAALPSVVNEVMNRGAGPAPTATKPKPRTRAEVMAAAVARIEANERAAAQQEAPYAP